jgi:hypothetical protein
MPTHDRAQDRNASRLPGRERTDLLHPRGGAIATRRTGWHMFPSKALELRILQLYIWSINEKRSIDGCRTATVARHGWYEVRLVEPLLDPQGDIIPFWIELFDHKNAVTIDSCGGYDFEETAAGAAALISQASLLHDAVAASQKTLSAVACSKDVLTGLPDCC